MISLICSSIFGSLVYFKNISKEELENLYSLEMNDIKKLQDYIIKCISIKYFGEEISLESLQNLASPTINVCLIDLFSYYFQNKQMNKLYGNITNQSFNQEIEQKIQILILKLISEREEVII